MAQQDELKVALCTIVCLDIAGYASQSVSVQLILRERLYQMLHQALQDVPDAERIVWDSASGVIISFLGETDCVLPVLQQLQQVLQNGEQVLQLYVAVNHGPVRLLCSEYGFPELVGDGVSVAQNILQLAEQNQILLSSSYCEELSNRCPVYHKHFQYLGTHTDFAVRSHELYALMEPALLPDNLSKRVMPVVYVAVCVALFLVMSVASVLQRTQEQYDIALVATDTPALSPTFKPRRTVNEVPVLQPAPMVEVKVAAVTVEQPVKPAVKDEPKPAEIKHEAPLPVEVVHENVTTENATLVSTVDSREAYIAVMCDKGTGVFIDGMPKGRITNAGLTMGILPGKHFVIVSHTSGNLYPQHVDVEPGQTLFIKPEICS